jgi:GT2 family glycosyltransferase
MLTAPPTPASVALIVLNYNTSDRVIALFEHVSRWRGSRDSVVHAAFVVVDNASREGEASKLTAYFAGRSNCHLLLNRENRGYAAGNNTGLRFAAKHGFDFCLIANSDIEFLTPDFLEHLVAAARSLPQCGLIGPRVVFPDGRPQGPLPVLGLATAIFPVAVQSVTSVTPVYATVGCCILGSSQTFGQLGFLDEGTFLYREEVILAERLVEHGLRWYYLPDVVVQHNHERKVRSLGAFLFHKRHEKVSTIYYFERYRHRRWGAILCYRVLLWGKTLVGALFCFAPRLIPQRTV